MKRIIARLRSYFQTTDSSLVVEDDYYLAKEPVKPSNADEATMRLLSDLESEETDDSRLTRIARLAGSEH